jgi:serine/threonine protein kinase
MSPSQADAPKHLKSRYKDFELLGAGAMGRVFKATDTILLIDVAIKVLLETRHVRSESAVRFQQEAKAVSKLQHKNILTIMDFGITEDGEPYLVMEYLQGRTLSTILDEVETFTLQQTINIAGQICDGMQHAHKVGVVHRDLKPANIMILGGDFETASIRILDFGIAMVEVEKRDASYISHPELLGSPQYMSPEQITSKKIDGRSDIYSLGCILFHMLTGRHAHESDSVLELLQSRCEIAAPRINSTGIEPIVPPAVEDVIARCLETDPAKRYATMLEVKEALLSACEISDHSHSEDVERKSPAAIFGLLSLVVLVIAAGAWFVFRPVQIDSTPAKKAAAPVAKATVYKNNDLKETNDVYDLFNVSNGRKEWSANGFIRDENLAALAHNPDVEELHLSGQNHLTAAGYKHIAQIPKLRILILSEANLKDDGLKALSALKRLHKLAIDGTAITDAGINFLRDMEINDLNIERTSVTDEGLKAIGTIRNMDRLLISNSEITNRGLKYIKHMPIKSFHMDGCDIDDGGMKDLPGTDSVKAPGRFTKAVEPTLERLYMSHCNISLRGFREIKAPKLSELILSGCPSVTDDCLKYFIRSWPKLRILLVNDTRVTRAGVNELPKLTGLEKVGIAALHLSDEDIAPIFKLKKLEAINLGANDFTDKTLRRLHELPHLKTVEMTHCQNITVEALTRTQQQLPDVEFFSPDKAAESIGTIEAVTGLMEKD